MTPPMNEAPSTGAPNKVAPAKGGQSAMQQVQAIAKDSEKRVPKPFLNGFHKIVAAGKKAMFSPQTYEASTKKYLDSIADISQVPEKVAHGVIKLLTVIYNQSKGTMPIEPVGLAANMFMCDGLEYLIEERQMPIDTAVIDQTTSLVKNGALKFIKDAAKTKYNLSDQDIDRGMTGQHDYAKAESAQAAPVAEEEEE